MKRGTLYIGLSMLGGIVIFIAISKYNKKKKLAHLYNILDTGGTTPGETFQSKADEGIVRKWEAVKSYAIIKEQVRAEQRRTGKNKITSIWDKISRPNAIATIRKELFSFNTDEDKIYNIFRQANSLRDVSLLNNGYMLKYTTGIFGDFKKKVNDPLGSKYQKLINTFKNKPLVILN